MKYPTGAMQMEGLVFQGWYSILKDFSLHIISFSFKEVSRRIQMKQYAIQIKEAMDLIKFSENAVKAKVMDEENTRQKFAKSKLKQKGNRAFSELL